MAASHAMRFTGLIIFLVWPALVLSSEPWFGIDLPDERSRKSEQHRTAAYAQPTLPPLSLRLADDPYTSITGAEVHRYLEEIVRITREQRPTGERYWGRIAGSAAELATAAYVEDRFREFGLADVRLEPVAGGKQWWPLEWSVTLAGDDAFGAGTTDLELVSAFPAIHLGEGAIDATVEAGLVWVGRGHPADLVGRDLRGQIAVVRAELQPDPFFLSARGYMEALSDAGAVGVIAVMDAPGNHQYALERMGAGAVPCLVLGGDDGRFLEELLAAAGPHPPRARLRLKAELRNAWQGQNVVAVVPGTTDENVLITAHLDSFFDGANDNGGGVAAMLALARHYADPATPRPRRGMVFIGTSAHHEFSDGAKAFVAAHPDLLDRTALVFNVEHPSSIKSYYRGALKLERFTLPGQLIATTAQSKRALTVSNANPALLAIYKESIDRYGLVVDATPERRPTGDAYDFFLAGSVVVQILDANLWFHSDADRIDTIHPHGLERATRAYAFVLDAIDELPMDAIHQ